MRMVEIAAKPEFLENSRALVHRPEGVAPGESFGVILPAGKRSVTGASEPAVDRYVSEQAIAFPR